MTVSILIPPNISDKSRLTLPVIWLDKEYSFTFINNSRSDDITLEITTLDENSNTVIIAKNKMVAIGVDMMNGNYNEYWQGRLYFIDSTNKDRKPSWDNFHTDYTMILITDDEFE